MLALALPPIRRPSKAGQIPSADHGGLCGITGLAAQVVHQTIGWGHKSRNNLRKPRQSNGGPPFIGFVTPMGGSVTALVGALYIFVFEGVNGRMDVAI